MKPMIKQVVDAHNYRSDTLRQKQNKTPKSAGCRKGTKTAYRQNVALELKREPLLM